MSLGSDLGRLKWSPIKDKMKQFYVYSFTEAEAFCCNLRVNKEIWSVFYQIFFIFLSLKVFVAKDLDPDSVKDWKV
jgi:hypothetical protein